MMEAPPSPPRTAPTRVSSVDAYRGFVMLLMMAEILHFAQVSKAFPDSDLWKTLAFHQEHVEWRGCSLHDLIQPSFSFLVGVALPFSIAARRARSQSVWLTTVHAVWRAVVLVFLGVFLRSVGKPQTNFTFEDTLTQIGLGYIFLFALGHLRMRWQWLSLAVILLGYWGAFALCSVPDPEYVIEMGNDLPMEERPMGFAAHWDKNTNAAAEFDRWFLNQFPRPKPFAFNRGGYATLSFIPTLGTMILGLIAGGWLRTPANEWSKISWFTFLGVVLLMSGWVLDGAGICPNVKRIWTPAWVLFSGGWCLVLLALFSALLDTGMPGGWAFPLKVIGANSIVAYVGEHLTRQFILDSFKTHFGANAFDFAGGFAPLVRGGLVLAIWWLALYWMYRRRIFVKI